MCGLTGIVSLNRQEIVQADSIHAMNNKIVHRGPDDEGYLLLDKSGYHIFKGNDTPEASNISKETPYYPVQHIQSAYGKKSILAFGHRRLSIIDLSPKGHQPMSYLDRYWIVYNGEIYNYIELRDILKNKGYGFSSNSDTEVLMAAYHEWGAECLNRFNGMWAFVLYDSHNHELFISRDRFGIKPLYYYCSKDMLIFASEIKALLAHPDIDTGVNPDYCKYYIENGPKEHVKETVFLNIYRFLHGHHYKVDLTNSKVQFVEEQYWDYAINTSKERYKDDKMQAYVEEYCNLLEDSVRLRLRADVKIGAALSGGVDSSSIVYLINRVLGQNNSSENLQTFSSVYQSEGVQHCDESRFIDQLAEHLKVKSNQIEPTLDVIKKEYQKMIYAMDSPPGGSNMGGWFTFRLIHGTDVIINLDGQGADEQIAGYHKYVWRYFANMKLSQAYQELKYFLRLPGLNKRKLLLSFMASFAVQYLIPKRLIQSKSRFAKKMNNYMADVNTELKKDTMAGQLTRLLHYGDRQSMAHSIESRLPFLDYRLVEFLASIPAAYKIHQGWTKYLSRLAMQNKLPNTIVWRKDKMGWPDPVEYWFDGELKGWLLEEITTSELLQQLDGGYASMRYLKKKPLIYHIRLFNLCLWYKIFFKSIDED